MKKEKKYGNVFINDDKTLSITIHKIKGLSGCLEIPLKNTVYALTGSNGSGKSTIMSILSKLVPPYPFRVSKADYTSDSSIKYEVGDIENSWFNKNGLISRKNHTEKQDIRSDGKYEGSLFYGKRFEDSKKVEELMAKGLITDDLIEDADDYIITKLGWILHGNEKYYKNIKKLQSKAVTSFNLKNHTYFYKVNDSLISQYRMSSGECLLLTLLNFLFNSIVLERIPVNKHTLLLVDEIELALHPLAIKRLIEFLQNLTSESANLTCLISSHSLEVIRSIPASNIYNMQIELNADNIRNFTIDNPIYPCYLMKDIYAHTGYDYVILVEDILTQRIVENVLRCHNLRDKKLINVVPIGGWNNVLLQHKHFVKENTLGIDTKIISVIDGDFKDEATSKFKDLPHTFLPIGSIEKFLLKYLVNMGNNSIKSSIKNTIFVGADSIDDFLNDYLSNRKDDDKKGKALFGKLSSYCLNQRKISEDKLVDILYGIAQKNIDFKDFENSIENML